MNVLSRKKFTSQKINMIPTNSLQRSIINVYNNFFQQKLNRIILISWELNKQAYRRVLEMQQRKNNMRTL